MTFVKPANSSNAEYYDQIAKGYNQLYGEEQREKARLLLQLLPVHGFLLDIGAGTGIATDLFRDKATCVLLDPSMKLLEQAEGIRVVGTAEALPFPAYTFDTIISLTALHHTDLSKSLAEIERVKKNDAAVGITILKQANIDWSLLKKYRKIDGDKDWIFISV